MKFAPILLHIPKMHPENIAVKDFTYQLPEAKIPLYPLEKRDESKLLIYDKGNISTDVYANIAAYMPSESLMIFNNSKVVEARLLFKKDTGGVIEIFCLEPHEKYGDITTAISETRQVQWLCLIGGASKWKDGLILKTDFIAKEKTYQLEARFIEKRNDCFVIELVWNSDFSFAEMLHYAGHIPLPPYIKREDETLDKTRYQTVFAENDGSVAAPTAGLHFTKKVLQSLSEKNIATQFVTLHVGAGTFKPVKTATLREHDMHYEMFEVRREVIESIIRQNNKPVIAVGTTSLRTLESLYWLGCKLIAHKNAFKDSIPSLTQWETYEMPKHSVEAALGNVLIFLQEHNLKKFVAKTQLIIVPGYEFKLVKGLVTNFHQPSSTLLLLIAAFIGDEWKRVYNYALENNFRFLSYGDGSLLWRKDI